LSQLLSKVAVASCSLYIKVQCVRFAVERRTLKMCCYRSRLVSVFALKTLTFHKVLYRHTWGVMGSLAIYYKFSPDTNSEISLRIGQYLIKLRRTKQCACFFGPPCT